MLAMSVKLLRGYIWSAGEVTSYGTQDGKSLLLWHQVANFLVLLQLRHDMRHLHSKVGTGRHSYTL